MIYDVSGIKWYGSVSHSAGLIQFTNGRFPTNIEVRNGGPENWILPEVWSAYVEDLLFVVG